MSDHLSPSATPQQVRVKRLNRNPAILVTVLALLVLSVFAYIIIQSGNRQKAEAEKKANRPYSLSTLEAESLLAGKPEHGAIKKDKVVKEPLVTAKQKPADAPIQKHAQPSIKPTANKKPTELEKQIAKIKSEKLKRFQQSLTAPMSKGGTVTNASSSNNTQNGLASLLANSMGTPGGKTTTSLTDKVQNLVPSMNFATGEDPNMQQKKKEFYMQDQAATEYLQHSRSKQVSPLEIKTGTVLPAIMLTGLNSDLPGMILAQISQNIYDTATGRYLLIPQGSRLVGSYDSFVAYGQDRALIAWKRMVYPDGSTLELKGMPGTDQQGYAGLEDQVDNHYFRIFGSALLISAISGIYEYMQDDGDNDDESVSNTMANAVGREMFQVSSQMLRKNLNIQPTIKIRPGYKLNVMVNKDIIFPAVW